MSTEAPRSTDRAKGFAFFAQQRLNPRWVINLPNYGAFLFAGTEEQAEEMRSHKARWEGEIAHKRPASVGDMDAPSPCWNHRGYIRFRRFDMRGRALKRPRPVHFYCECGSCSNEF